MHVATTKQPRNFVKAYHDVLSDLRFNLNDKMVYLTLLSYQEAGVQVFPSNSKIAESLGVSESSVKRSTSALEKAGLISKNRRFNKTNLITVNKWTGQNDPSIRSNCTVQTGQIAPSREVKMTSYKNRDKNKDKISLEEEGQTQASLSQEDDGLEETRIHCDESDSALNLGKHDSVNNPVKNDLLVTQTYASMPSDPDENYFEPDTDSDYMDDEAVHHMEQRAEQRNQQISAHFSTQQHPSSAVPTREEYQHMMGATRIKQFEHKPNKPDWL